MRLSQMVGRDAVPTDAGERRPSARRGSGRDPGRPARSGAAIIFGRHTLGAAGDGKGEEVGERRPIGAKGDGKGKGEEETRIGDAATD
ncbi:hypothetical protein THAOC_25211, partial [Thalassiosira oceanica]